MSRKIGIVSEGVILKQKKKPKDIKECSEYNYGFKKLIEQLDTLATKE